MIEMNDQLDDSVGKDPLVRVRNRAVKVPNAFDDVGEMGGSPFSLHPRAERRVDPLRDQRPGTELAVAVVGHAVAWRL
jgi:hypothetical protein